MKIYLLSNNIEMIHEWKRRNVYMNVNISFMNLKAFMARHKDIECIVCPGNSYGHMDGGYDAAVVEAIGKELQHKVYEEIQTKCKGKQEIGTSIYVQISNKYIIYTPTLEYPDDIMDGAVVNQCTESALRLARQLGVESVVLPSFGGGTGRLEYKEIAKRMAEVIYNQQHDRKPVWG